MEKTVVLDGKSSPKTKNYLSIHKKKARVSDNVLYVLIYLSASISVILLIGIIGYVFAKGISRVSWSFLTSVTSALKGTTGLPVTFSIQFILFYLPFWWQHLLELALPYI
mgnify:CR=1 FL=1